jgi:hypothetical protein
MTISHCALMQNVFAAKKLLWVIDYNLQAQVMQSKGVIDRE